MDNTTKEHIRQCLERFAEPMDKREFTREAYNKLFPMGEVKTPLETVKLGANHFDKLKTRGPTDSLGAMHQTLSDPVVILPKEREGKEAHLYIKTFREEADRR
jgi:hypothetical protein